MRVPRLLVALAATAVLAVTGAAVAPGASATTQHHHQLGTKSLAAVLTSDGNQFDRNSRDYDIVTEAVLAVLAAKPGSPVGVLADGSTPVTAFLPNDQAFRLLVKDLTGKTVRSEKGVFEAVAGLGIDTVETVLLYHVVPGATITKRAALRSDGAALTTAQGGTVTVDVRGCWFPRVTLIDQDRNDRNPRVVRFDINRGNLQIAHGVDRVLRPIDL
jgi:fasciclin domain-containing protein